MSPRLKKLHGLGKHPQLKKVLKGTSIFFLVAFLGLCGWVITVAAQTPSWDPNALSNQNQSSRVYDKDGNLIAQLHAGENRLTAQSSEIPDLVKKAFVAVEDKRFYNHIGVDPIRIIGSALRDISSGSAKEGASTITIQLARNAFIDDPTAKTLTRKIQEAILAIQLEHKYTKEEILTFYLNKIYFGEASYGIRAAAQTYFGKEKLTDLTPDEVALLAGLPQAPSGYDPYVHPDDAKTRRDIVLGVMKDAGIINSTQYDTYKESGFNYVEHTKNTKGGVQRASVAATDYQFPYFVDYVIDELENTYGITEDQIYHGGLQIYTTVDPKIQSAAETAFANASNFPQSVDNNTKVQGAMTLLEPSTGAIRAMVGGRDYTTRGLNRAKDAMRQPGSTIKPLVVYGPALEKGGYFTGTVLDDMPVSYNAGNGQTWAPVDFDTETSGWKGLITMRYAVENSVNVYAVKLMNMIGVEYGWKFGKNSLDLPLVDSERNNLSLALGTTHVSTLDMATAYGAYANNGVMVTTHALEKVLNSKGTQVVSPQITKQRVMKETTAYIMNSLLRSVVTSGTGTRAQIGNWYVCGKTGTTSLDPKYYGSKSGNPDAWFAGYTPTYAAVVWMGYDSDPDYNHYLRKVYGGSYPAQIWKQVMTAALQDQPVVSSIPQPDGIVSGAFDTKSGLLPSNLTPSQFIATDIAAQGSFPTATSSIWVEKAVDADNPNQLAGPMTTNTIMKVFLNITRDPSLTWPPSEAPYRMPTGFNTDSTSSNTSASATSRNSTSPPTGDSSIPTPSIGPVSFNAATGKATIPVFSPSDADNYNIVIYLKRPGKDIEKINTGENALKSENVTVQLQSGKKPLPAGDYIFWAALADPSGSALGPPSNSVKLTLSD